MASTLQGPHLRAEGHNGARRQAAASGGGSRQARAQHVPTAPKREGGGRMAGWQRGGAHRCSHARSTCVNSPKTHHPRMCAPGRVKVDHRHFHPRRRVGGQQRLKALVRHALVRVVQGGAPPAASGGGRAAGGRRACQAWRRGARGWPHCALGHRHLAGWSRECGRGSHAAREQVRITGAWRAAGLRDRCRNAQERTERLRLPRAGLKVLHRPPPSDRAAARRAAGLATCRQLPSVRRLRAQMCVLQCRASSTGHEIKGEYEGR